MTVTQRVLVTGGTSPIGAAVVERLRALGAAVVFTGRSAHGDALADRTGARFVRADVRALTAVRQSVHTAVDLLGGLDGLVLVAGAGHLGPLAQTPDDVWDTLIETNVLAPCVYATECLPALSAGDGGTIVAVSSASAIWPDVAAAAYAVSKRALSALAEMLAVEGGPQGVRVNVVCPGDTGHGMAADSGDGDRHLPPLGRRAQPTDVAAAVAFFLSETAACCTGATLVVDGGMNAAHRAWAVSRS